MSNSGMVGFVIEFGEVINDPFSLTSFFIKESTIISIIFLGKITVNNTNLMLMLLSHQIAI